MPDDTSITKLASSLRERARALEPGDRLPSTRELIATHRVSPVTLSRAVAILAAEGILLTRPGSGTYVAERAPATVAHRDFSWQTLALGDRSVDASDIDYLLQQESEGMISLAGGYLHASLLPGRALASALARAARRPDASERPPLSGLSALRAWFARGAGASFDAENVLITSGGQAAVSVALRAIVPLGGSVLVESPGYIGAIAVARAAGLRVVPVPVDHDGVRPELLEAAFAASGARAFYCQPTFQNPTGSVLAGERRAQLLEVARSAGAFIIEDDFARLLHHERLAPPPLLADDCDGRVVQVVSLTKVSSPNLRVGALVARGPVAERLRALHLVDDFFVPRTLQEAALELVSSPGWRPHLARLSRALIERRTVLLKTLSEELPVAEVEQRPRGGFNVWARLPDSVDDLELARSSRRAGVLVSPGRPFFTAEPPASYVRLSFASVAGLAELTEGVRRLALGMRAMTGG